IARIADQDSERRIGFALTAQPADQGHGVLGQTDENDERAAEPDQKSITLRPRDRGDNAECGDEQQQWAEKPW
ncbi:hypothetical protein, partial [Salmonella sp. SAL4450]|uniref:hypothetical protein n=1 Tax=Salmonella sp. SAL4450 TaxID=3159905 RepID=UPI00397DDBA0